MNREMWAHPATQRNIELLKQDGTTVFGPQRSTATAKPVMAVRRAHQLLSELIAYFQPKSFAGKRVLITAGPTVETIDPVRHH